MLQRKSLPLRVRALVLTIAIVLAGATPVFAQADQTETPAPPIALAAPIPPTPPAPPGPPAPPAAPMAPSLPPPPLAIPPAPPEPPGPSHPVDQDARTHGNSDHVYALTDGNALHAVDDSKGPGVSKSQQRKHRALANKQRERGHQQWIRNEHLRVANEAARREAERMINAASPMDWRNRYSSD